MPYDASLGRHGLPQLCCLIRTAQCVPLEEHPWGGIHGVASMGWHPWGGIQGVASMGWHPGGGIHGVAHVRHHISLDISYFTCRVHIASHTSHTSHCMLPTHPGTKAGGRGTWVLRQWLGQRFSLDFLRHNEHASYPDPAPSYHT